MMIDKFPSKISNYQYLEMKENKVENSMMNEKHFDCVMKQKGKITAELTIN